METGARNLKWVLHKGTYQITSKYTRRYSTLLFVREMQTEATVKYYYKPTTTANIKKRLTTPTVAEDVKQPELLDTGSEWYGSTTI
jgi:hypothetical protein